MCKPAKKQLLVDIMFHMSVMHSSGQLRVFPMNLFGLLACAWLNSFNRIAHGLSHSRCRQLMGICQGNKKNTSESAVRTCGGVHPVCLVGLAVCTPCVLWGWLYAPRVPYGVLAVCTPCVLWGWLYGSRVWIANELTVQLMLSYGAQGNIALLPTCPIPPAMRPRA